jgi:hypothetical protein
LRACLGKWIVAVSQARGHIGYHSREALLDLRQSHSNIRTIE